jgi:hypothetical protein
VNELRTKRWRARPRNWRGLDTPARRGPGLRLRSPGDDAYITEEDIRRAAARWEELAPPAMRHLLDAEPVDVDEPPPSAKI